MNSEGREGGEGGREARRGGNHGAPRDCHDCLVFVLSVKFLCLWKTKQKERGHAMAMYAVLPFTPRLRKPLLGMFVVFIASPPPYIFVLSAFTRPFFFSLCFAPFFR